MVVLGGGGDNRVLSYVRPISTYNNFFVGVIQPSLITYQLKEKTFPTKYYSLLKTLKKEDNPILFFYSLK